MTVSRPFFVVPLDLGTITTGNEVSGYPASNLNRHKALGLTWKSNGASNLWVRGDFGSAQEIDFMSVVSANAIPATDIRLRLGDTQGEVDGAADYDSTALDFISPSITREDGLYHSHLELGSVETKRWWRIDITSHTGDFQASHLVLGKRFTPTRFYDYEHMEGPEDLGDADWTRFGVFDEDPGVVFRSKQFTLSWLTEAEYEASVRPMLEKLGKRGVVFLCFDPTANTYRQARTYMGWMKKPPYATGKRKPGVLGIDFNILSMI